MTGLEPPAGDPGRTDGWVVLATPAAAAHWGRIPSARAVVGRLFAATAVVSLLIGVLAFFVSNSLAERDTLDEGVRISAILANEVRPRLGAALNAADPAALQALDAGIRPAISQFGVLRIKLFDGSGRVLYSDEQRLIGQRFTFTEVERAALAGTDPLAAITTPEGAENEYEQFSGRLVEVRRPLVSDAGARHLLEVYLDYDLVSERARAMWGAFLALLVGSLTLLTLLVIPVAQQLRRRIAEAGEQRELLLRRAVDASERERRRIAASLHDGPVQELVGHTLALARTADRLVQAGQADAAAPVADAAAAVRGTVGTLRTLLVDLYPPGLDEQGLPGALDDLLVPLRSRGVSTTLRIEDAPLSDPDRRLVHRVCQECLRNAAKHSGATAVGVVLAASGGGWTLTVSDNGHGFDVERTVADPVPGHLGLRILADLAADAGASLRVSSDADGTTWELRKDST